ncbi:MAG: tRNA (adenosine(37)-N6)-threonylcarbamoyltransferase complex transferase subunit TsaD [Acutalibacteraceae bacterium]|nr:tRNA (adenosine(37)-N6)-threonylcarbamoyltransferase complex transferase subunit TsaD [Acutalibacteraceae bacterium]
MKILAIESSCDETAAAVVEDGRKVLSSVIASQVSEHIVYGGVVPEIASRMHAQAISGVVSKAMSDAGVGYSDIDAIAVTYAPGLIGALLVGVNFAKGLAYSTGLPLIPVHHLRSHIAANYISHAELEPPFLCLVVSGGHSHIVAVNDYTDFSIIGRTRDDAAGECMDKAARAMGLPYPGGVNLDKISVDGDASLYKLPHPHVDGSEYDFSFSGLKTAVVNIIHNSKQKGIEVSVPDLGATCIETVSDCLVKNTVKAAENYGFDKIVLAGGVSANSRLRKRMDAVCKEKGWQLYMPELSLCGDNAAMVGAQAYYEFKNGNIAGLELNAFATMPINE